jgi:hypothetical protein
VLDDAEKEKVALLSVSCSFAKQVVVGNFVELGDYRQHMPNAKRPSIAEQSGT